MKSCPTCQASYPANYAVCPQDGTTLIELGAWADGTVVRGKYRILSKVGQGGMGSVFKALHLAFDELRALKVMNPELVRDELFVKRFKHEAVITRKLQHPHAVRVDDIDEAEDGRPFIVMEYIEGKSLRKLIQEVGPLPVPRVCSIMKQVASALDAAHQLGMIHRDIKPENIVLIGGPGKGEAPPNPHPAAGETPTGNEIAKVLDFGIAKLREARLGEAAGMTLTGTGVVIGTPQYMSPEQAMGKRGDELDGRSDLYSLGVVMYQMLTGELPFKADTTMEMLLAHMQRPPTPIEALRPELQIPEAVSRLVMRCLEKKRELRPESARALIEDIGRAERVSAPSLGATRVATPREAFAQGQRGGAGSPADLSLGQSPGVPSRTPVAVGRGAVSPAPRISPPVQVPVPILVEQPHHAPSPTAAPAAGYAVPGQVTQPKQSQPVLWVLATLLAVGIGGAGVYLYNQKSTEPVRPVETTPPPVQKEAAKPPETITQPPPVQTEIPKAPEVAAPAKEAVGAGSVHPAKVGKAFETVPVPKRPTGARGREISDIAASQERRQPERRADSKEVQGDIALGDLFYNRGEYNSAIGEYRKALRADPTNLAARIKLEKAVKARDAESRVLQ